MMKCIFFIVVAVFGFFVLVFVVGEILVLLQFKWSFQGLFGIFDWVQFQCGFKVYWEVCVFCYGLSYVVFCNLLQFGGLEFFEVQVWVFVAEYKIQDGLNDVGDMFECFGCVVDCFLLLFLNENVVVVVNGGKVLLDLFLMVKVCIYECGFFWWIMDIFCQYLENGVDYFVVLFNGYYEVFVGFIVLAGGYYNEYYLGYIIVMLKLINDGQVEYLKNEVGQFQVLEMVDQYVCDVMVFFIWMVELYFEVCKCFGFQVILFLIVFVGFFYFIKKKIWVWVGGEVDGYVMFLMIYNL